MLIVVCYSYLSTFVIIFLVLPSVCSTNLVNTKIFRRISAKLARSLSRTPQMFRVKGQSLCVCCWQRHNATSDATVSTRQSSASVGESAEGCRAVVAGIDRFQWRLNADCGGRVSWLNVSVHGRWGLVGSARQRPAQRFLDAVLLLFVREINKMFVFVVNSRIIFGFSWVRRLRLHFLKITWCFVSRQDEQSSTSWYSKVWLHPVCNCNVM